MKESVSGNALIKRIRRALKHNGWHLVAAAGDWYRNDRKVDTGYVLDDCGDVLGHYFDLVTLERDLDALRGPAGGNAMEANVGLDAAQASPPPDDVDEWEGLTDEEGRLWVSWPKRQKNNHDW